jgi:serine/threonine protein kinase
MSANDSSRRLLACPGREELLAFSIGKVPEDVQQAITDHLDGCPRCLTELQALDDRSDYLIADLRKPVLADLSSEAVCQRVLGQFDTKDDAPRTTGVADGEPKQWGDYRILEKLGQGGMGTVYKAVHTRLGKIVAVKVLAPERVRSPSAVARFEREMKAVGGLEHPNLVRALDAREENGEHLLVMEYLEGSDLAKLVRRHGPLPVADACEIVRQAAVGLHYAHTQGQLVHRDIKPSNLMLTPGGCVKVLDLGLARLNRESWEGREPSADVFLSSEEHMGTVDYMAPEQWREPHTVNIRADIYSLGCTLYDLLASCPPYDGPTYDSITKKMRGHADIPLPPVRERRPEVPEALAAVLDRLVAKQPGDRFATADEVAEALQPFCTGHDLPALLQPKPDIQSAVCHPSRSRTRWFSRSRLRRCGVAAVLLFTLGFLSCLFIPLFFRPGANTTTQPKQLLDRPKPFVLIRAESGQQEDFKSLLEALAALQNGDTIEVYGNGPFTIGPVRLREKGLTLRAAPGYRPQFVAAEWIAIPRVWPVPNEWIAAVNVWFGIEKAPLLLEGCDFHCRPGVTLFHGGGAPWEIRNCRLLSEAWHSSHYLGPKLRLVDCLIQVTIRLGPKVEVDFTNNVGRTGIVLSDPGGQTVRLHNNTLIQWCSGLLFVPDIKKDADVTVVAEGNIFYLGSTVLFMRDITDVGILRDRLRWQGRHNLYVGAPGIADNFGKGTASGLADWNQFWGRVEEGSQSADRLLLQWEEVCHQRPIDALKALQKIVAALRLKHGETLNDFGPDWELIGPGEAYTRALAAEGKLVAHEQLRPRALAEGPFAVWHRGKVLRGYITLPEAVEAAVDGDTIEIRSDGPFGGIDRRAVMQGKELILRAAPGYRPVVEGDIGLAPRDAWSVEGISFHGGIYGSPSANDQGRIARLANCSFENSEAPFCINARFQAHGGQPAVVVNCLMPTLAGLTLTPGHKLLVRNSLALGSFSLTLPNEGEHPLELERCVIWSPSLGGLIFWDSLWGSSKGKVAIAARGTLFEASGPMIAADRIAHWNGSRNVYRLGLCDWFNGGQRLVGLAAWRSHWKSPEEGSVEAEPTDYDPTQWRLLPSSPGYRAGPGGKDFGADVDRVAQRTKTD